MILDGYLGQGLMFFVNNRDFEALLWLGARRRVPNSPGHPRPRMTCGLRTITDLRPIRTANGPRHGPHSFMPEELLAILRHVNAVPADAASPPAGIALVSRESCIDGARLQLVHTK